jgi:hypothetical protein
MIQLEYCVDSDVKYHNYNDIIPCHFLLYCSIYLLMCKPYTPIVQVLVTLLNITPGNRISNDVKKRHRCVPKDNEFRCLANGRSNQGGCRAKWNNCIPQDIDTSCLYDNDPRWFPQAMYVTESHHIVLIFSLLNRTTLTFVLKLSPLQVAKFDVCAQYK